MKGRNLIGATVLGLVSAFNCYMAGDKLLEYHNTKYIYNWEAPLASIQTGQPPSESLVEALANAEQSSSEQWGLGLTYALLGAVTGVTSIHYASRHGKK